MANGWTISPTAKSVVAKQASEMLDFVRRCRFVFTATITRLFSKIAKGKVKIFKAVVIANTEYTSEVIFVWFFERNSKPLKGDVAFGILILYDRVLSRANPFFFSYWTVFYGAWLQRNNLLLFFDFQFSTIVLSVLMYGRKVEELSGKVLKFWLLLFVTIQGQFALFRVF